MNWFTILFYRTFPNLWKKEVLRFPKHADWMCDQCEDGCVNNFFAEGDIDVCRHSCEEKEDMYYDA
jgi:hypothetical protein